MEQWIAPLEEQLVAPLEEQLVAPLEEQFVAPLEEQKAPLSKKREVAPLQEEVGLGPEFEVWWLSLVALEDHQMLVVGR